MSAKLRELLAREPGPHVLPALLECDLARLADVARQCQDAGARILHLDVMDGHFVPNLTYGPPVIRSLHRATPLLLDAHLMMSDPEQYIEPLAEAGCATLTVHIEVVPDPRALLKRIRGRSVLAGLALNPPTPLDFVKPYLDVCDLVLPLSVMPGWGGQKFDPLTLEKLRWLRQHGPKDLILESDGGLNRDTIASVAAAGANLLVAGSALFRAVGFAAAFTLLSDLAKQGAATTSPANTTQSLRR